MKASGDLQLAIGLASRTGQRPDNQDFVAAYEGMQHERITHGALAMLADGMGGHRGGRIAAELACRSFLDAYYSIPATLGITTAADRALSGFNCWLHAIARTDPEMTGAGTTFSAVILRGRQAHLLHVGDSRIWHLRGTKLTQLTTDHVLPQPEHSHILYRAVGLEPTVRLDHVSQPLELHDRLLITSDGVHDVVPKHLLEELVGLRGPTARDAQSIVDTAIASGSADNASAILIDVVSLPDPDLASR